jgi:hypothetical protein
VILAGVYNIKNIKLKMIREGSHTSTVTEDKTYNSPWNIAVNFDVDMSFSAPEIATMLQTYENDHNTGMDITAVSEELRRFTGGYPYLVSRVCQYIDEKLSPESWTVAGVQGAIPKISFERSVLYDDVFKNLANDRDVYDFMYALLIIGDRTKRSIFSPIVERCEMYGFISLDEQGNAAISNKIFEIIMTDYFISEEDDANKSAEYVCGGLFQEIVKSSGFDMELCLRKFAEHYEEQYTERDMAFYERHGRLLFLSFLKPLVHGYGNFYIESQFTDMRRMDIVVDFRGRQFIIELKLWRGEKARENAYTQLLSYMNSKKLSEGYLLTFDLRKGQSRETKAEWVEIDDDDATKRIFDVIV